MDFKAIVFDAYGTLFDVNSAAEKCKHKIGDRWEAFANFWRTTQLEYTWLRSLMKRHKDFWQITEDSLDKSMKVFNIDKSMKNELLNLYKVLSPYPEVKEVLTDLKKKNLKLAILSNGTPDLINELVNTNKLDTTFDDLFSIEEVKIYKPDSRVYDLPVNKYKIQPSKFVVENELLYPEGCAIKYIIRHRDKGKKQDILKAIHFLEMIIERDYNETDI